MADQVKVGDIYRITSRNLLVGVCTSTKGFHPRSADITEGIGTFIGIREKFGARYLSEEMGWNAVRIGTVPPGTALNTRSKRLRRCLAQHEWRQARTSLAKDNHLNMKGDKP